MSKKLPWWKFFSKDFQADADLKTVSLEAVGLWPYMMCLMHDSQRRGYLTRDGKPFPTDQLAAICGRPTVTVTRLLTELTTAGVFSVSPEGLVYSRRMVRETAIAEERSKAGKRGGRKTQSLLKQKSSNSLITPLPSCISSLENQEESYGVKYGGAGEDLLKQNLKQTIKQNFSDSPAGLAQEFTFHQTGGKEDEFLIREKIEGLEADGHNREKIIDLIRSRKNKAERFFKIEKRLEREKPKEKKGPRALTSEEIDLYNEGKL